MLPSATEGEASSRIADPTVHSSDAERAVVGGRKYFGRRPRLTGGLL